MFALFGSPTGKENQPTVHTGAYYSPNLKNELLLLTSACFEEKRKVAHSIFYKHVFIGRVDTASSKLKIAFSQFNGPNLSRPPVISVSPFILSAGTIRSSLYISKKYPVPMENRATAMPTDTISFSSDYQRPRKSRRPRPITEHRREQNRKAQKVYRKCLQWACWSAFRRHEQSLV